MEQLLIVAAVAAAVPAGNYMINKKLGMTTIENMRESKMWGVGFVIYAILDGLVILH